MENIGRWVRAEWERRYPNWEAGVGMLGTAASYMGLIFLVRDKLPVASALAGATLITGASWLPLVRRARLNRHRPNLQSLITAHRRGHLAEALGEHAKGLDDAARDLDQIGLLVDKAPMPPELSKAIRQEARRRMGEAVDLCVGAPALHGFSTEEARGRIVADVAWMASARTTLEKMVLGRSEESAADPLERLREMLEEREAAYAELKA